MNNDVDLVLQNRTTDNELVDEFKNKNGFVTMKEKNDGVVRYLSLYKQP